MQRSSLVRPILVAVALIGSSAASWSADRKGEMEVSCCDYTFHLQVVHKAAQNVSSDREIVVSLHRGCPPYTPLDAWVGAGWGMSPRNSVTWGQAIVSLQQVPGFDLIL